ncbi:MAG: peptidoglycan-binding protein [Clostridia bacterium]|nr:peptidoglycan-binding protein [Clostridia bacterium]
MREDSTRQSAANRARMRRMRAQYRRRLAVAGIIFFILGIVAGIFANRWYANRRPDITSSLPTPTVEATAEPEPTEEPRSEAAVESQTEAESADDGFGWGLFEGSDEGNAEGDATPKSENAAFPEIEAADASEQQVEAPAEVTEAPTAEPTEAPTAEPTEAPTPEPTEAPTPEPTEAPTAEPTEAPAAVEASAAETVSEQDMSSDQVAEYDPAEAEVPDEYLSIEDENGEAEMESAAEVEAENPAEAVASEGPQVIAIVPFGESFTYNTQIKADGNARVEATDEPYETISFTQTMKDYMRPTDFANKYSTQYKLQGNEAGAGFELVLNDYAGEAAIVPQNVVDIGLRSESGNTVERGYQLMDAEIAGNYNVAMNANEPKMLYKRFEYASNREDMFYLVVTTYNDGVAQQILFQLESDEPEPEPEVVYNTLQRGIKSDEVASLQARLIELGYLSGTADGSFGQYTEDAIKAAQEAFGMEANGIADNAFQQKLFEGAEPAVAETKTYETLDLNSTGDKVVTLQVRLRDLGYYDGKADGGYGAMTEAAVKRAQEAYGMEATGVADDAFQQRLYSADQP